MKAIITAAGKNLRFGKYENKCILPLPNGGNLLKHNISKVENLVDEIIIVVSHRTLDDVVKTIGVDNNKIKYIVQDEQHGYPHAIYTGAYKDDDYIVLLGDNYFETSIESLDMRDTSSACLRANINSEDDKDQLFEVIKGFYYGGPLFLTSESIRVLKKHIDKNPVCTTEEMFIMLNIEHVFDYEPWFDIRNIYHYYLLLSYLYTK